MEVLRFLTLGFTAVMLRAFFRSVFFLYIGLITLSVFLAVARLNETNAIPGLGAIELMLLALPWSLSLGVAPISRLGLSGMFIVIFTGLALNLFLLRSLAQLVGRRYSSSPPDRASSAEAR